MIRYCPMDGNELTPIERPSRNEGYTYTLRCPSCGALLGRDRLQQSDRHTSGHPIEREVWRICASK